MSGPKDIEGEVERIVNSGAVDRRLDTPMSDAERLWAERTAPKVLGQVLRTETIDTTARETASPTPRVIGTQVMHDVILAYIEAKPVRTASQAEAPVDLRRLMAGPAPSLQAFFNSQRIPDGRI